MGDEVARWSGMGGSLRRSFGKANKAGLVVLMPAAFFSGTAAGSLPALRPLRPQKAQAYGLCCRVASDRTFAEGYTGPGFEERILAFNPYAPFGSGKEIPVKPALLNNEGHIGTYASSTQPLGQRYSLNMDQAAESFGYSGDVSAAAFSDREPHLVPFICERALSFDYQGQTRGGSHAFGCQEGETG